MSTEFIKKMRALESEVDCRISHGADSGGHLEYVRNCLKRDLDKYASASSSILDPEASLDKPEAGGVELEDCTFVNDPKSGITLTDKTEAVDEPTYCVGMSGRPAQAAMRCKKCEELMTSQSQVCKTEAVDKEDGCECETPFFDPSNVDYATGKYSCRVCNKIIEEKKPDKQTLYERAYNIRDEYVGLTFNKDGVRYFIDASEFLEREDS